MNTHRLSRHPIDVTIDVLLVLGRVTLWLARVALVFLALYAIATVVRALLANK